MRGFSLIELLVVVALVGMIVALAVPLARGMQGRAELDATAEELIGALRQAQRDAIAVKNDARHGVHIEPGRFVRFQGASFAERDSAFDIGTDLAGGIMLQSALTDIVFEKFTGETTNAGAISVQSDTGKKDISVNAAGRVNRD